MVIIEEMPAKKRILSKVAPKKKCLFPAAPRNVLWSLITDGVSRKTVWFVSLKGWTGLINYWNPNKPTCWYRLAQLWLCFRCLIIQKAGVLQSFCWKKKSQEKPVLDCTLITICSVFRVWVIVWRIPNWVWCVSSVCLWWWERQIPLDNAR